MLDELQASSQIKQLTKLIAEHDNAYYNDDAPTVSDAEYDKLRQELEQLEAQYPNLISANSPSQKVGAEPNTKFSKITHKTPMLSIGNGFSEEDISDFITRCQKFLGLEQQPIPLFCEPKIDGVSFSVYYEHGQLKYGASRGNGQIGEDITANIKTIAGLPHSLPNAPDVLEIRGEIYLSHTEFERINKERTKNDEPLFANPRNAASGSLRQLDSNITAGRHLQYFAYSVGECSQLPANNQIELLDWLSSLGFNINPLNKLCNNIDEIIANYNAIYTNRPNLEYDIDGMVYKVNDFTLQQRLGNLARTPRWAIAHKFAAEQAKTRVNDITIQVGRTGALTPVAELEPINVGGVIVSRATLHNEDEITRKDIRIGDIVIIQRAGDVIPQIVEVDLTQRSKDSTAYIYPTSCPECGSATERPEGEAIRRCTNNISCPAQVAESIKHFVSRQALNIDGLGDKQIEALYNDGLLKTPADIFRLNYNILVERERMAEKSTNNLLASIKNAADIELNKFLFALGIRHIGDGTAKLIAGHYEDIDNLISNIANDNEALTNIDGLGAKAVEAITSYFSNADNMSYIQDLLQYLHVKPYVTQVVESAISGKSIVFTGTLIKMSRAEAKQKAEQLGAKVASSISSKTDILVAGEKAGSKLKKAAELGVKTVTEDEWLEMV